MTKESKTSSYECWRSATYKITTPLSEHALYVTICDQDQQPWRIEFNSKNMEHFQWIAGIKELVDMAFQTGSAHEVCERLKTIRDPGGGYFRRGGGFLPSLVAHIAEVIEEHLRVLGGEIVVPYFALTQPNSHECSEAGQ